MTPQQTLQDIKDVMTRVIAAGLSDQQNYPAFRNRGQNASEIYIEGSPDLSISMKDIPYRDIYFALESGRAYNIKMIDGALIQMAYTFERRDIASHRLSFFPSPTLEIYEKIEDLYESDEVYGDAVGKFSVRFPIRFDYSEDDLQHIDVDHPKSHLTLGQYEGCRIPVGGPLTPSRFMRFILRNFYNPAYPRADLDIFARANAFADSITANERGIAHLIA